MPVKLPPEEKYRTTAKLLQSAHEQRNPLERIAGSYADDPFWDEFLQALEDSRRALDSNTEKAE
ncbi:MAG: hypothetical protein M3Y28_02075 [Armatimonadota bacterium]|nr:hypothetical protein [Armatimonadota bacterium]